MKYFTLKEMEYSSTAVQKKMPNPIPRDQLLNWIWLIEKVLDPIREAYKKPIRVNSGFRTLQLNNAIGGSKTSQHMGLNNTAAADISGGSPGENKQIYNIADRLQKEGKIDFDQLIDENNMQWVHIGIKIKDPNRRQRLKIVNGKTVSIN